MASRVIRLAVGHPRMVSSLSNHFCAQSEYDPCRLSDGLVAQRLVNGKDRILVLRV